MSDNRPVQPIQTLSPFTLGVLILLLWVIPIVQISFGSVYLHDCPRQPYIPIYLIVVGVFSLLLSCQPRQKQQGNSPASISWNFLIATFFICWFIAGNVWIYSIFQPNYNKNTTDISTYCNKILYLFAFCTTTMGYTIVVLLIVRGSIFCCFLPASQPHTINV